MTIDQHDLDNQKRLTILHDQMIELDELIDYHERQGNDDIVSIARQDLSKLLKESMTITPTGFYWCHKDKELRPLIS